jgi:hypothetical protein
MSGEWIAHETLWNPSMTGHSHSILTDRPEDRSLPMKSGLPPRHDIDGRSPPLQASHGRIDFQLAMFTKIDMFT